MESYKKEDISVLYFEKKMSTTEISKLIGMSASGVSYYLRTHGYTLRTRGDATKIAKRTFGKQKINVDREAVVVMYLDEKMSVGDIGKIVGLTPGAICSILRRRNVKMRTPNETTALKFPEGRRGENTSNWRGGRRRVGTKGAYIYKYSPEHPNSKDGGYVMEHRLVMEEKLGRLLTKDEIVHHINGDKKDNNIENLELVSDRGTHTREHFERSHKTKQLEEALRALDPNHPLLTDIDK